jgi:toxin CcdB
MTQYCIHKNARADEAKVIPYLLDVQSNLLKRLSTCVAIPLKKKSAVNEQTMTNLNPTLLIKGEAYILQTQLLAAIPRAQLGEIVQNCSDQSHIITNAIDAVLSGI